MRKFKYTGKHTSYFTLDKIYSEIVLTHSSYSTVLLKNDKGTIGNYYIEDFKDVTREQIIDEILA